MERNRKVKELFLSGVEDSMNQIFGKDAAKTVHYYLKKNFSLKPEDILEKPEVFSNAIEKMFGKLGAEVIEMVIIKKLFSKFELVLQRKEGYRFSDYVNELHTSTLKKTHSDI